MSNRDRMAGPVAVSGAAFLWSLDGYLRRNLYSLPAPVIVFWEHALGGLLALPLVARSFTEFARFTAKQWWAIVGVSLLSGALGTIFYTSALSKVNFIPFSVVVLLQQLQPLFTIGLAKLVLRERLDLKFLGVAVLALAAAYAVSFPQLTVNLATGAGTAVAAALALAAAASWGSSTVLSKFALTGTSFLHVTAVRFWITPLMALMVGAVTGSLGSLTAITGSQVAYLVAITLSTGFVALGLYYWGLQRVPAAVSTILELTWPISAVVVGYLAFGDRLTFTQWLGSVVLVGTMVYLSRHRTELEPTSVQ